MLTTKRRVTYGKSWWGQAWVSLLDDMDPNQFSRGKTFANTGRVQSLTIRKGVLKAKVVVSYHDLYTVEYRLRPFTEDQIQALKVLFADRPSLALALQTGQFSKEFSELLDERGISLLPEDWVEFDTHCQCYDYANPCKHMAAVHLVMANQLDADPNLLFKLRGVEKLTSLLSATSKKAQQRSLPVTHHPAIQSISGIRKAEVSFKQVAYQDLRPSVNGLSFRFPRRQVSVLLALMTDAPSFFPKGNFKDFLYHLYHVVPEQVSQVFSPVPAVEEDGFALSGRDLQWELYRETQHAKTLFLWHVGAHPQRETPQTLAQSLSDSLKPMALAIDERVRQCYPQAQQSCQIPRNQAAHLFGQHQPMPLLTLGGDESADWVAETPGLMLHPKDALLDAIISTPFSSIIESDESRRLVFSKLLASFALGLAQSGQFTPEILVTQPDLFGIRYVPQLQDPTVANTFQRLVDLMPKDLVTTMEGEHVYTTGILTDLVADILTHIVQRILKGAEWPHHEVFALFVDGLTLASKKSIRIQTIQTGLANWLEPLHLARLPIAPVLNITPAEDDHVETVFHLSVSVQNRLDPLGHPLTPYAHLFAKPVSRPSRSQLGSKAKAEKHKLFGFHLSDLQGTVSRQLTTASHYLPELLTIIDSQGQASVRLDLDRITEILLNAQPILEALGFAMVLPKAFQKLLRPELTVRGKLRKSTETGASYLNLNQLMDFSYEVALGEGAEMSLADFKALVKQSQGLVKFRDQFILIQPDELRKLLERAKKPLPCAQSPMQALFTAVSEEVDGIRFKADEALQRLIQDLNRVEPVDLPKTLDATLRPYQERGYRWLWTNLNKGFGTCLADDMGLGKTIQVISLLLKLYTEQGLETPSLVICPTSLLGNWQKEFEKFGPDLRVSLYHGSERTFPKAGSFQVLLTSYGIFRRDFTKFKKRDWYLLAIDEAQNIKNSQTEQTKAVKALPALARIAMTGTPVENRLTELWNLFDFINPGYLGSMSHFKTMLANPIEQTHDQQAIERLRKVTAPFILRRLKTDKHIIADLPEKVSITEYCSLTTSQAALYQQVLNQTMETIQAANGIERKGLIFKLMTALKQVCNHPAHFLGQGAPDPTISGKAAKTLELVQALLDNQEKALIFTQFTEMGSLLVDMLREATGIPPLFFHGGLSRGKRDAMVDAFQTDPKAKLMILSLKAGGTGLNLTAASSVIHYDLWWNPAVENQATDRAYRIGQDQRVMVHRLVTMGTFEEKINAMIQSKQHLADLTVYTGEQWITEISDQDLRELFCLTVTGDSRR
jgi:uncharacterized Zn finger protein/superfamily II DNA or RNA helicase